MNKRVIMILVVLALTTVSVFAQAEPAAQQGGGVLWGVISAAFVLGIAAAAGAIGQSKAIAAACEGIARNPSAAGAIRLVAGTGLALLAARDISARSSAFNTRGGR